VKILAVEDDSVARSVLLKALRGLGHETIGASDGEIAWSLLETEPIKMVVSDWIMPNGDGLDLCRRIRARPDYIYFILLTGRGASEENRRAATDAGVDDFLTKPVDMEELWTRLRVAERILRYTTQVRQLEQMLPICSDRKKSATTTTIGSRWKPTSTSAPGASSATRCAPTATSGGDAGNCEAARSAARERAQS
jgi:DNA-binding response OmpR family regulator